MNARIVQVSQPSIEPVTVAEARSQVRQDITDDDAQLTMMIASARRLCEAWSHLCFINQTFDLFIDRIFTGPGIGFYGTAYSPGFAGYTLYANPQRDNQIVLPHGPLQSVTYFKYYDTSGDLQTWASSNYLVSTGSVRGRVAPKQNNYFPTTADQIDAINVRYVAGYGATADLVPSLAKSAILLALGHLYEHREATSDMSLSEIPLGAKDLLKGLSGGAELFA